METDNNTVNVPITWEPITWERKPIVYRTGDTYKKFLPDYLKRIKEHYGSSSAPGDRIKELSPFDFHRKWMSGCYKDKEWTSSIMKIAPSVVSVSIFIGVQRKVDCTGLVIRWDDSTNKATVLACAKLLRIPEDEDRDDYYIVVRLPNGKILLAEEQYVDFYHNIMTLEVTSDAKLKPVDVYEQLHSPEIKEGIDVVALSRDFYTCSLEESRGVVHVDYPYFGCEQLVSSTCSGSEDGEGGPLITRMGQVCGINFFDGNESYHPLPILVISSRLKLWDTHGYYLPWLAKVEFSSLSGGKHVAIVVQPWFGLTVIDIDELPYDALETIATNAISKTAVVKQVHEGSPADGTGVCPGDLVVKLEVGSNIFQISSASQYSRVLSSIAGFLSASCTHKNLDSTGHIKVSVYTGASGNLRVVCAKNLSVDDRRFCCSWPGDEHTGFRNPGPVLGSQTDCAFDVGFNDRVWT